MRLLYGHSSDIIVSMANITAISGLKTDNFTVIVTAVIVAIACSGCDSINPQEDDNRVGYSELVLVSSEQVGTDREEHATSGVLLHNGDVLISASVDGRGLPCDGSVGKPALIHLPSSPAAQVTEVFRDSREGGLFSLVNSGDRLFGIRWIRVPDGVCSSERFAELVEVDVTGGVETLWTGTGTWSRSRILESQGSGQISLVLNGTLEDAQVASFNSNGSTLWSYRPESNENLNDAATDSQGRLHVLSDNPGGWYSVTVLNRSGTLESRLSIVADSFRVATNIAAHQDGTTVLGYLRPQAGADAIVFATRFDSEGNAVWNYRVQADSPYSRPSAILALPNGYTLIGFNVSGDDNQTTKSAIQLHLLNEHGDLVSSSTFGEDNCTTILNQLLQINDTQVLAIGSIGPNQTWEAGNDFDVLTTRHALN